VSVAFTTSAWFNVYAYLECSFSLFSANQWKC